MDPCTGIFEGTRSRPCERPYGHDGHHGNLAVAYERFRPPRALAQYVGIRGNEIGDQSLTPAAFDALALSKTSGEPSELVVIGVYIHEDGVRFLDYGVPRDYIEAHSDYKWHDEQKRLRLFCKACRMWDGKHTRNCDR